MFESFRNKCIEIYEPGLAWQACLKFRGVKLELSTDNDMLMMIEK